MIYVKFSYMKVPEIKKNSESIITSLFVSQQTPSAFNF